MSQRKRSENVSTGWNYSSTVVWKHIVWILCVHCLLESIDELDLPLCQTLFDHHQQSGSVRRSEACREQVSPWTQTHQAQVIIGKLRGGRGRGQGEMLLNGQCQPTSHCRYRVCPHPYLALRAGYTLSWRRKWLPGLLHRQTWGG